MVMNRTALGLSALFTAAMILVPKSAFAVDVIEFPDDELAAESVLPVFDQPESVKNRTVTLKKRVELGVFGGYALTEPFYSPMSFGVNATYHFDEVHGINLMGSMNMTGLSDYGNQLNPIPGSSPPENMNLQFAPAPKYLFLGNYQFTAYYGKLSFTKQYIMNLHLYGLAGAGMIGVGDSAKPVLSPGIGQKFYFTPSLALRFDLRFLFYQGPNVLSRNLTADRTVRSAADFEQKLNIGSVLSVGATYLFPGF